MNLFISTDKLQSRKRKLDLDQASDNEVWNELHVQLVRDLEKRGMLWRYGVKHLKFWTDLVLSGESSGVGEEPDWQQHLDKVHTPPKSRRSSPSTTASSSSTSSSEGGQPLGMMGMFLIQNQQRMEAENRRSEMFQTTLLTLLSSNMSMLKKNQV